MTLLQNFVVIFCKSSMNNIILFGPPGSGKGTQAPLMASQYNLIHISTGDIFRKEMANGTSLGNMVSEIINSGNLVPDETTIEILRQEVLRHPQSEGFIFDGFPRTVDQAKALDLMLGEMNESISMIIVLDVQEDVLIQRIQSRASMTDRKAELDLEVIKQRLRVYNEQTSPVLDYYAGIESIPVIDVDGNQPIETVMMMIERSMQSLSGIYKTNECDV